MQQSPRFWAVFVIVSALFLGAWYYYWEVKKGNLHLSPISEEFGNDLKTLVRLSKDVIDTNGEERVFLVLFQNNMELRPGGGFVGSFGILKIKDGRVTEFTSHDTINFDGRIPDTVAAPYPYWETLKVKWLKLRDSNVSPDWFVNAVAAENFYRLGGGTEEFAGVIGITTNVLTSFLTITGPVEVPGYPGKYDAENGVLDLEYQVERAFVEQGITRGDRKQVMHLLGNIILEKVKDLSLTDKYKLFRVVLDDLHKKDIQIYFKDERLHGIASAAGWTGRVDQEWGADYLMTVDSNMSALKTDYRMKRRLDYTLDMRGEVPQAVATVTYEHTGKEKDYMTRDYQTFLRLYVPEGSWLESAEGTKHPVVFGTELKKKYFGTIFQVPLATTKSITFRYTLPKSVDPATYDLKIEKQPGVNDMPVTVTILEKDGSTTKRESVLNRSFVFTEAE